jgi:hypothetical protein
MTIVTHVHHYKRPKKARAATIEEKQLKALPEERARGRKRGPPELTAVFKADDAPMSDDLKQLAEPDGEPMSDDVGSLPPPSVPAMARGAEP